MAERLWCDRYTHLLVKTTDSVAVSGRPTCLGSGHGDIHYVCYAPSVDEIRVVGLILASLGCVRYLRRAFCFIVGDTVACHDAVYDFLMQVSQDMFIKAWKTYERRGGWLVRPSVEKVEIENGEILLLGEKCMRGTFLQTRTLSREHW